MHACTFAPQSSCRVSIVNLSPHTSPQFHINGRWHTWIDYERFHELIGSGEPFGALDYILPTPSWAVYGADERGFDPAETRFTKKKGQGRVPKD